MACNGKEIMMKNISDVSCYCGQKGSLVILIDLRMVDCIQANEGLSFIREPGVIDITYIWGECKFVEKTETEKSLLLNPTLILQQNLMNNLQPIKHDKNISKEHPVPSLVVVVVALSLFLSCLFSLVCCLIVLTSSMLDYFVNLYHAFSLLWCKILFNIDRLCFDPSCGHLPQ